MNSKKNRENKSESDSFQSSNPESTTTPPFRDDQDMVRNHQKIEKAGPTSSLSTPPITQPAQSRTFEEAIIKRSSETKVEASLDKLTRIPFSETTGNVANHRKGGYTPISLEVWQTLTWTPHVKQIVVSGKCLRSKIVSDVNATRHQNPGGKPYRKAVNIVQMETEAELMQRKFLL